MSSALLDSRTRRLLAMLALLAAVPHVARAQGAPSRGALPDSLPALSPEERARQEQAMEARRREVLHPVGLILAHRAQLALTDSQATRLAEIRARFDERLEPAQRRIDSLRAELGEAMALARGGGLGAEDRERFRLARLALNETLAGARADDRALREATQAVLTTEQQGVLQQIEVAAQKQLSAEASRQAGWTGDDVGAPRRGPAGRRGGRGGSGVGSVSGPGGPPSR